MIGFGSGLHWVGDKLSLSAPWWAWGLIVAASALFSTLVDAGNHISGQILAMREKLGADINSVSLSLDRLEREVKPRERT